MEFVFEDHEEYSDRTFKRINCRNQTIVGVTFLSCTFINCAFQESTFKSCKFRDCVFQECELRLMHVPNSSFRNTQFKQSNVSGVNWAEAVWSKGGRLESIELTDCDLSYSVFIGLELPKLVITRCIANHADFAEANLTQANCTYTDFAECRFLHTNLTEADFTRANNYAIDVTLNTVKKAKFSLPEAIGLLRCMNITLIDG